MDQGSFDRLARLLGGATSRRSGLKAALGAAFGFGAIDSSAKGKGHPSEANPGAEGPCGNGTRKDNICQKDSQCCTGICDLATGKKNKDKKGRCRCLANGRSCKQDKNCCKSSICFDGLCGDCRRKNQTCEESSDCCGGNVCIAGVCLPCRATNDACYTDGDCCGSNRCLDGICQPCLANGKSCTSNAECCDGSNCIDGTCASCLPEGASCGNPIFGKSAASLDCCDGLSCIDDICTAPKDVKTGDPCIAEFDTCKDPKAYCSNYEWDVPTGTYCVLDRKEACDKDGDCWSHDCPGGICVACTHPACAITCNPTVCKTCLRKTIQSAIDAATSGDIIDIDAGYYIEDLRVNKDIVLRACKGKPVTIQNKSYDTRTITVTGPFYLHLIDITVESLSDPANGLYGGGIITPWYLGLFRYSSVRSGAWQEGGGIHFGRYVQSGFDPKTTAATATKGFVNSPAKRHNNDKALGKRAQQHKAAGFHPESVTPASDSYNGLWIADQSIIEGNSADSLGGGIYATEFIPEATSGLQPANDPTFAPIVWVSHGAVIRDNTVTGQFFQTNSITPEKDGGDGGG
ncbi:MAG: hypothetical protein ACR2J8_15800, partial [Thermomicrobiales bacterium]